LESAERPSSNGRPFFALGLPRDSCDALSASQRQPKERGQPCPRVRRGFGRHARTWLSALRKSSRRVT